MQLKLKEAIKTIQSKCNEINQIKEEIKASNEFRPNLSFDTVLFGQLNLGEYSNFDPFKSQILTGQQPMQLIKLCEFDSKEFLKI